jgi:hypothetical protein
VNTPHSLLFNCCFGVGHSSVSSIEQLYAFLSDTLVRVIETLGEFVVETKYLHISAYSCDKCEGPVIAGSFGTRETEITRETDLTQIGAVCLSCGNKQTERLDADVVRQFAPIEWASLKGNRGRSFG